MSDVSAKPCLAKALAAFDETYADFLAAFREVPDAALPYVPEGDEYSLGILPLHLQDPLHDYIAQLDQMLAANFAPLDLSADPAHAAAAQAQHHADLAAQRPTAADRAPMLAGLEAAHQNARHRLSALDEATFTRTAPVIYSAGAAPIPTSAADIAGWLTDHYREHIAQTQSLLADWQSSQGW